MNEQFVLDVTDRLARIEEKLDASLTRSVDQETRIRSLETKRAWFAGAISVLSIALSYGTTLLARWMSHK